MQINGDAADLPMADPAFKSDPASKTGLKLCLPGNYMPGNYIEALPDTDIQALGNNALADDPNQVLSEAMHCFIAFWSPLKPIQRLVLQEIIFAVDKPKMIHFAHKANLSTETIRKYRNKLTARLSELCKDTNSFGYWLQKAAMSVKSQVGPVVQESDLAACISSTLASVEDFLRSKSVNAKRSVNTKQYCACCRINASMPFIESVIESVMFVVEKLLREKLGYASSYNEFYLDESAVSVSNYLRCVAKLIADDVGLINETELQSYLPNEVWRQHWNILVMHSDLHHISWKSGLAHGPLTLLHTTPARVKAAVLSIGRPATKLEIAEITDMPLAAISTQLSAMQSVVRADKTRWGLREWVDHEYKGIASEIERHIKQEGGSTRMDKLVEDIPKMFGVSKQSVKSYVSTRKFTFSKGYVKLADISAITFRSLDEVAHGHTIDGLPYWTFKVKKRFFEGHSILKLPIEVAKALGCGPDQRIRVPVCVPDGCKPVSVCWPLASHHDVSIGYASGPLRKINAAQGEYARIIVDECNRKVSFQMESEKTSVLFLCVHNAGRSQIAAGYLRHIAKQRIDVFSGGSSPSADLNPTVVEAMAEENIDISQEQPKLWTDSVVRSADVIITMGCGDVCPILPGKKYETWDLEDPSGHRIEKIRVIRDDIKNRVLQLIKTLDAGVSDADTTFTDTAVTTVADTFSTNNNTTADNAVKKTDTDMKEAI